MSNKQTAPETLDLECAVLTKYLIQQAPNPYVLAKYREAHQASPKLAQLHPSPFDQLLVALSRQNAVAAKMVDAYAALFFRNALVRKKMVVLLAILESCAPTYIVFDQVDPGGARMFVLRFVQQGILFAITFVLAMILLMPLHLGFELQSLVAQMWNRLATRLQTIDSDLPVERTTRTPANAPEIKSRANT